MKALLLLVAVNLAVLSSGKFILRSQFPDDIPPMKQNSVDPGKPLFLSPYIEKKQFDLAQNLSRVGPIAGVDQESYAGFMTVNKSINSNMYFWFFPSQIDAANAPVLLWLQGGPGGSSLFGLFNENGPLTVTKDIKVEKKPITWNSKYSMLYIDNPVGTGFSFTDNDAGYARNEVDVGRDLYSCLVQFFQVFYQLQKNDFYITGESYAGKYVPAIGYKIHMENQKPFTPVHINLVGMAIGDGLCDPETMMSEYGDYMYNIGMLDTKQKEFFNSYADIAVQAIKNKDFRRAFDIFDFLLNGDLYPYKPYFYNMTLSQNYYNFLYTEGPEDFGYYYKLLAEPAVRKAIHVGNLTYNNGEPVEKNLINDIMDTVKPWVAVLMDNYKVLMYTGQLDIIVATPLTEAFLMTVPWSKLAQYKIADRMVWKIHDSDREVAGYVRQVDSFYQVIVRTGGHILPYDQPARAFDMINRFVTNTGFS